MVTESLLVCQNPLTYLDPVLGLVSIFCVNGLFDSFARLDSRIFSVGQTAAKIGDHLQGADSQRETASQTMELIKRQFDPLIGSFAEEDLGRQGVTIQSNATVSRGLEVAVGNLQEYCNGTPVGTSAMQHYVGLQPMFDVEVMNADTRLVLGDQDSLPSPSSVSCALSSLYCSEKVATITAVFPSPNDVMSILVQRSYLVKPSLVHPPPMGEGGLLLYLRMLAVGYEKTQELAKDLRTVGCGDLDIECTTLLASVR
ncbi:exocyst complex component SEC10b-like [Rutidosis leptorrhynchoides]|uniref:exocyst complex component SEC10b-like n=1 Tax=Rutidosis leptorrhynchoides TaxID=125765 RepID=UPI003A99C62C